MRKIKTGLFLVTALYTSQAAAAPSFTPTDLSGLSTDMVSSLVKTAAIGGDFRSMAPATPLGYTIGVDLGVDVTAISVPDEFKAALALATGKPSTEIPASLLLPRINVHKGFPFGVDLGFSYIQYEQYLKMYGFDAKYALIPGNVALPSVALRASYNHQFMWFMNANTIKTDLVVSKNFYVMEPYAGLGLQFWSGDIEVPTNLPAGMGLPATVSGHASGTTPHFYGGLAFKLLVLKITGELDYSTAGITTYGAKISLGF